MPLDTAFSFDGSKIEQYPPYEKKLLLKQAYPEKNKAYKL